MITEIYEIEEHKTYEELSDPALYADYEVEMKLEEDPFVDIVFVSSYNIDGFNVDSCKELAEYGYNVYCQQFADDNGEIIYTIGNIDPKRKLFYPRTGSLLVDTFPLNINTKTFNEFEDNYETDNDENILSSFPKTLDDHLIVLGIAEEALDFVTEIIESEEFENLDDESLVSINELISDIINVLDYENFIVNNCLFELSDDSDE